MGGIAHKAIKPFKNWNAVNRAIRQTEKDALKPRAATRIHMKTDFSQDNIMNERNQKLIEEINTFEITSTDVIEGNRVQTKSHRPLPKKQLPYDIDYSGETQVEPIIIPEGKITISLLIEMLKRYRDDISIEELADMYKLPPEKVYNILRFNRLFVLNPPGDKLRMLMADDDNNNTVDDDSSVQKEPGATTLLYPEAYGKYNPSE